MFNPSLFYLFGDNKSLLSNLVGYYKFENDVVDSTGLLPTATATGTDFISGKVNQAIRFNASTDRVDIPDTTLLSFTSGGGADIPFSISTWVYFTSFNSGGNWIINKRDATSGGDEWQMYRSAFNAGINFVKFDRNSNSIYQAIVTSQGALSLNTWYHMVFTDNGSKTNAGMKVYLNGVSQTPTIDNAGVYTGMNNGTSITRMGLNSWNLSSPTLAHQGYLDEIAIWKDRVLTQTEVSFLYNSGNGRTYPNLI